MKRWTILLLLAFVAAAPAPKRNPITNGAEWINDRPVSLASVRRPKAESVLIYQPETEWTYSHHPSLAFFKGRFYAIWSNGRRDEDAPGQRVLLATSADFLHWTTPHPLVDSVKDDQGVERVLTAAGFHQHGGTLVAYFGNYGPHKETTHLQAVTTTDGEHWSAVREMGVPVNPNHGPQRTASGRLIICGNIVPLHRRSRRLDRLADDRPVSARDGCDDQGRPGLLQAGGPASRLAGGALRRLFLSD